MGMLQLIYISTARPGLGSGDFETLLARSRTRNRDDGITSVVIYDGSRFLQTLEGPEGHVERCFARIALDPRHSGVDIKFLRTVLAKSFGDWDMQFHRIDDGHNVSALMMIDAMAGRLGDSEMRNAIRGFCGIRRRAAA